MRIVYDQQVRAFINDFRKALTKYPIRRFRKEQKIRNLRKFFQNISDVTQYPPCRSKVLGQIFDLNGEPLLPELHESKYKDESGFQWRFSLFQESKNIIRIYRIVGSKKVFESITKQQLYENLIYEISNIINKHLHLKQ